MKKLMICVPITAKSKEDIVKMAEQLAKLPIQLIEWRIDFFEELADYEKVAELTLELKKLLGKKLLVTWRTAAEGGERVSKKVSYVHMLQTLISHKACDMIDIEMEREEARETDVLALAKAAGIEVIGSYHNFQETPSEKEMVNRLVSMKEIGFDIAKIAVMPQSAEDVDTLLSATEKMKRKYPDYPLITMSMGEMGQKSRLYGWLYGSSVTFASVFGCSAPGQVDVETVRKALVLGNAGKKHIILTGFMGTGKSTISQILKEMTGKKEIDTDRFIEREEGRTIKDIFATDGEEAFRQSETALIDKLETMEAGIVSCGGGMVLRDFEC